MADREDSGPHDLTVEILRDIRDEVRGVRDEVAGVRDEVTGVRDEVGALRDEVGALRKDTNERFEETNERLQQTNGRIDLSNSRLDLLAKGQARVANEVLTLRHRFEHFLATEDDVIRDLRDRVERLETHAGLDSGLS